MSIAVSGITVDEVDASIARVIASAESIWDEWAWQVENKTWLVGNRWSSWEEMRHAAYGSLTSISAPRAERPELVARFRRAGLTQQQTADTLGVERRTVQRHDAPTYSKATNVASDEVVDAEFVDDDEDYVTDQVTQLAAAGAAQARADLATAGPMPTDLAQRIGGLLIAAQQKRQNAQGTTGQQRPA